MLLQETASPILIHPFPALIVTAGSRGWELGTPACTLKLRCNNRNDEECDDGSLASKGDSWATVSNPFNLEIDNAKAT
jgi:hypothetical protein